MTSRTFRGHATYKLGMGYFTSAFLLSTGLVALISPTTMATGFGMPIQANTFAAGFVQCFGSRNLMLGLLNTVFVRNGNLQAAGLLASLLAVDGFLDGIVTYKYAGALASVPHVVAAAIIPFVGRWMTVSYTHLTLPTKRIV